MPNPLNQSHNFDTIQGEFLELLLQEEATYPWNPADPELKSYLTDLEQEFCLVDWSDSEILSRQETLFNNLEASFSLNAGVTSVERSVIERFGQVIPHDCLRAIATQSQQVIDTNLSRLEQLVQAVRTFLSDWSEEDLQVFARPLAFDMRDGQDDPLPNVLDSSPQCPWDELSSIEQVKQCMRVAHYALSQLDTVKSKQDSL